MKNGTVAKGTPVIVFSNHHGIYFGYMVEDHVTHVVLERARDCWSYITTCSGDDKGVYALATTGPKEGSRIGPRVTMFIRDVNKVVPCAPKAVEAWEAATWP